MGQLKSRGEKSQKRKDQKKEDAGARKGRNVVKHWKSRNTVFSQWFGAPEGRKVGLAKAAGAEPARQMREEKLHAVVARSTFPSQNVQNTPVVGPLLEVAMSKKCTPLWREAHFEVKMFWRFRCRFASLHYNTLHYTTLHFTTLHYITLTFTTLHYTTLHYTTTTTTQLHSTTLHYLPLHFTT